MNKPTFVYVTYVTYIAATPERVWEAPPKPDLSEKHWFGYRVQADGQAGNRMTAFNAAGRLAHDDPIIESDPPRRLSYVWQPLYKEMEGERPSRVTFELTPLKDQTRLTIVHDEFDEGSKIFGMISKGWPAVPSSMKSFLETGRGLQPSWDDEAARRPAEAQA